MLEKVAMIFGKMLSKEDIGRELQTFQNMQEAHNWYLYHNLGPEYLLITKCIAGEREIINFEVFKKITEI